MTFPPTDVYSTILTLEMWRSIAAMAISTGVWRSGVYEQDIWCLSPHGGAGMPIWLLDAAEEQEQGHRCWISGNIRSSRQILIRYFTILMSGIDLRVAHALCPRLNIVQVYSQGSSEHSLPPGFRSQRLDHLGVHNAPRLIIGNGLYYGICNQIRFQRFFNRSTEYARQAASN